MEGTAYRYLGHWWFSQARTQLINRPGASLKLAGVCKSLGWDGLAYHQYFAVGSLPVWNAQWSLSRDKHFREELYGLLQIL